MLFSEKIGLESDLAGDNVNSYKKERIRYKDFLGFYSYNVFKAAARNFYAVLP